MMLLSALTAPDLFACTCGTLRLEQRVRAEFLFIGEAIEGADANSSRDAKFEVLESFTQRPRTGETIDATNGNCGGIQFEPGRRYLVYGRKFPSTAYGNLIEVGSCAGTVAVDDAVDEISYVREWTRRNPYSQNRLSGIVMGVTGKPASNVRVELVLADLVTPKALKLDFTDEFGRFEFTKVPPGEYKLGVNVEFEPSPSRPYPTIFFPGVNDRSQAATIRIYGSEHLDGFNLNLADRLPTRYVSVQVLWWDNTPVTNADVICRAGTSNEDYRMSFGERTAMDGTVDFTIFASDRFEISIVGLNWRSTGRLQPPTGFVFDAPIIRGEAGLERQYVLFVISEQNDQRKTLIPWAR